MALQLLFLNFPPKKENRLYCGYRILPSFFITMTNTILILLVCSTVVTSVVNAMKPAFKKFSGKYTVTVCTFISFLLGVLASFSVAPYLWYELNDGIIVLIWLALGTGSNLVYDVWDIIKSTWDKIKWVVNKE